MGRPTRQEDYLTSEEIDRLHRIKKVHKIYLKDLGKMCGIDDKGYWSNVMTNHRPLLPGTRNKLQEIFDTYEV